jgi:HSP20 family protein
MWHPFSDFDRTFNLMNGLWGRLDRSSRSSQPSFEVATALFETSDGYEFRIDVPGASEEDLQLDLFEQTLTLTARRTLKPREGWSTHRAERQSFEWQRSFTFPTKLDRDKVVAKLEHGVLTVKLARAPEIQPRKVAINVA